MGQAALLTAGIATMAAIAGVALLIFGARSRRQARDLAEVNRRFVATFEQTAVGVAHLDTRGRVIRINKRFCEITGYDREELLQLTADDITHPDDRANDRATRRAMAKGELDHSQVEKRYVRKDGSIVWVQSTRSTVRDADGRPEFFVAVVEEITARKETEARLLSGEAQYRAIFDSAVEAVAVIDARGVVQSVNPSVERVFGYAPAELIGRNIKMLMPESIQARHDDYLARYRETGRRAIIGIGREVEGRRKDGTVFPLGLSVAEWKRGEDSFFTGIMRDMSARTEAERALVSSEERLRVLQNEFAHLARVNDLGEMAAAIAHEINQPLAAVVNYLNSGIFLSHDGYTEENFADVVEDMEQASAQALRAGEIVRRLREFIGHGSGARSIERVGPLVDAAMALGLIDARSAGIVVEKQIEAEDCQVEVDTVQIQQVIVNLLRNAVEAMTGMDKRRERRLLVCARPEGDSAVSISISDTGPGIAPDVHDRLFQPFVTSKSNGMGMGLSVCRRLIEAHGGTIEVENRGGKGATFTFRLPRIDTTGK